ncbi:MAG: beta-hydroxyacyl-ACP dehydratase [Planctomycetaceae bacterium]|jgi:3-hydroxyacyl-[acyl-carrier-protein] dehydratase|nr:beta-hydroxyacyl-ACP dehydratase [Planctomycetaceae bacterium]MDC0274499.1 beta-hydroxyacyl-ACP dehydratase [Planctomycetaceae bacterium]MDG2390098.1 beta-hydroxyacyl-ACP dehydratase [Planctomycetaceae bacterium]
MDREDILKAIPHRAPFLWIDEVVSIDEKTIHARTYLDPELPVFQGHFPDYPVFPGVLQCEAALQAGAILISKIEPVPTSDVPVATRINNVKFRQMVKPGETIDIEVKLTDNLSNAYFMTGKISVEGKVSTRLEFACATAPVE